MFKLILIALALTSTLSNVSMAHADPSPTAAEHEQVQAFLKQADRYRKQDERAKVRIQLAQYKGDEKLNSKDYLVHVFPDQQSLVIMKSPKEKGQKVLMMGDNYWMIMPKSRRPIRITPMQKLIGEASTGDIATLTWAGDYAGQQVESTDTTRTLDLTAQRKGLTYHRILLTLDRTTHFPLHADLFVKSGKMVKQAEFLRGRLVGETQDSVIGMKLKDAINKNKRTHVMYLERSESTLSPKVLNPSYLIRNRHIE